jgi:hypothetical protein
MAVTEDVWPVTFQAQILSSRTSDSRNDWNIIFSVADLRNAM